MNIWCDHYVRIINVCSITFSDFYLTEGAYYERLSEFSRFSKCENDGITLRRAKNFEWEPQLVVGVLKLPLYAKKQISKPSSYFNQLRTYK